MSASSFAHLISDRHHGRLEMHPSNLQKLGMSARTCAYCGCPGNLTREHLWPASLHERLMRANKTTENSFWLRKIDAEIAGEPKIKDVCKRCNNGPLSQLDNYICTLFDRYFARILSQHEKIDFEYDYHLLKRWLLKLCFNSARLHSSIDLFAYPPLLSYISGQSLSVGRSVQLFLQLSYPGLVPPERLQDPDLQGAPRLWEPQDNRVGFMGFQVSDKDRKVLRAVHLRSYSFFLAFSKPGTKISIAEDFSSEFLHRMPATVMLRASDTHVGLVCNGVDAWRSYDGAREASFVTS
jgi:hypothetical protein